MRLLNHDLQNHHRSRHRRSFHCMYGPIYTVHVSTRSAVQVDQTYTSTSSTLVAILALHQLAPSLATTREKTHIKPITATLRQHRHTSRIAFLLGIHFATIRRALGRLHIVVAELSGRTAGSIRAAGEVAALASLAQMGTRYALVVPREEIVVVGYRGGGII